MKLVGQLLVNFKEHVFKWYLRYLSGLAITIIAICVYGKISGKLTIDQIIKISGSGITILSIMFAGFQFRANHDWNRRHAAITAANKVNKEMSEEIITLDNAFNYIRRVADDPISVKEIHRAICRTDARGRLIRDREDKLIIDHRENGGKVKKAIMARLNSLEFLATGVIQGIFDETVIYKLSGGTLISTCAIFKEYIKHLNSMYPERDGKIYENLVYMARKFTKEEKKAKAITERGKTG